MTKFVQFADENRMRVIGEFGNPQDPEVYSNQGEVDEDDPLWIEFCARQTAIVVATDPLEKLKAFLTANPDVAAIIK